MTTTPGSESSNSKRQEQQPLTADELERQAREANMSREEMARKIAQDSLQAHQQTNAQGAGQQQPASQGIAPTDPHQTNQNVTTSPHKTASRTPGEAAPAIGNDSGSAWSNDQQNPTG